MSAWVLAGWCVVAGMVLEFISIFIVTPQRKMPFDDLLNRVKFGDAVAGVGRALLGLALLAALIGFLK